MRGDESQLLEQICVAIKRSPYSVEETAERAKVSYQILHCWLNGKVKSPRITTLEKVADALGYSIMLQRGGAALVLVTPPAPPSLAVQAARTAQRSSALLRMQMRRLGR